VKGSVHGEGEKSGGKKTFSIETNKKKTKINTNGVCNE